MVSLEMADRRVPPKGGEEFVVVGGLCPTREVEARRAERRLAVARPLGEAAETKYYVVSNTLGILSQNTWSAAIGSSGVWAGIALGTDQNQRLGRRIRVKRFRMVLSPSPMAYDTTWAVSCVLRVDSNIASSDLFATSGTARAPLDYPNPVGQSAVYHHKVGTAMELVGGAAGTTPSYASTLTIVDQKWDRGLTISYDVSGPTGPLPIVYTCVSETAITLGFVAQVWFEDA